MCIFFVEKVKKVLTKKKKYSTIITVRGIPSAKDKHREKGDFMKKKWFSALAALAVLSFAAAPMNGYAVDEESLDDELAVAVTTEAHCRYSCHNRHTDANNQFFRLYNGYR